MAVARPTVIILTILAAEEALRRLVLILWRRKRARFSGLDSFVSFSACLIAAKRAQETELPDAYISDPLAAGLCGEEALAWSKGSVQQQQQQQEGNNDQSEERQHVEERKRPIARLIMRTMFFDDVASIVTWRGEGGSAAAAAHTCHSGLVTACRSAAPCLQVVLLGSGLDARPWRLALPPGVRWFEVDRRDVLTAKQTRLRALGAQMQPNSPAAALSATGASSPAMAAAASPHRYPLLAASWSGCAVDLQHRGWSAGLVRAGLDPTAPVLWILEGLLYYLEEADVRALLQEAAAVSGPGSILSASVVLARGPDQPSTDAAAAPGTNSSTAGASDSASDTANGTVTGVVTSGGTGSGKEGGSSGGGKEGSSSGGGDKGAGSGGGGKGAGTSRALKLHDKFKWRCKGDAPTFMAECGWRSLWSTSWLDTAASYGLPTADKVASGVYLTAVKLA